MVGATCSSTSGNTGGKKMKRSTYLARTGRRGSALVLSMMFVAVLSAMAMAMATISGANVQVADNQRQSSRALASAHSGLEVLRHYLGNVEFLSGAPQDRLEAISHKLQANLADTQNINVAYDPGTLTISIAPVTLDSVVDQQFAATITYGKDENDQWDYNVLEITITGSGGHAIKRVGVHYNFEEIGNPIFDYGIATKGPLMTQGNVDIETFNEMFAADIYIESLNSSVALEMIGKSSIGGEVTIGNSTANFLIANSSSILGDKGEEAETHIKVAEELLDFPVPNPSEFTTYSLTPYDPNMGKTFTNVEIPPDTNPSFEGGTTISGIMYVHQPNVVTFRGNATITGIIVAHGDLDNPSELNQLDFGGTVTSYDASNLSEEEFGTLTEQTGTFIVAPGFSVSFGGNASMINGVIAASGVEFYGHAGGTINGSIINYSDDRMDMTGNTDLLFNRSGRDKVPAGFTPQTTLTFVSDSYREYI